ncbi:MAG: DUF192 domain-containing protein [Bacteroidota bacterium]
MKNAKLPRYFYHLLYCLFISGLLLASCDKKKSQEQASTKTQATVPPSNSLILRTEAEVVFISKQTGADLARVSAQLSDTEEERNTGLMNRPAMADSSGMLFMMDELKPQSFWMKNTAISLDIIFVNDNKEIVKIHAYTTPYAIDSFPSEKDALYVVEVNGGFCEKHQIKEGDSIRFTLASQSPANPN